MPIISVSEFQPFAARQGIDTVLPLSFSFDRDVIETIKTGLRSFRRESGDTNVGGWLPEHRAWFIERDAWLCVRSHLQDAGYDVIGPEAEEDRPARQPLPLAASRAAPVTPASDSTFRRALDALDSVHDRADQLCQELRDKPPDPAETVAVLGAAVAASASLSAENIAGLTDVVRQGKQPRSRSA
jgi:hypothetical protein